MTPIIFEEVLTVQAMDGQYLFESLDPHDDPWPTPWQALLTGEDTWIAVLTGTPYGPVSVRVQVRRTSPDTVDDAWEMIGERDLWCSHAGLALHDLYSGTTGHHFDVAPGPYRVRVHVTGRAAAAALGDTTVAVEQHFLQIWPTLEDAEPTLHKGPDTYALTYR